MGNWADCDAVERDPAVASGAWVFRGTRVPVAALFENLRDGVTPQGFVALFPGVTQSRVDTVLEHEMVAAAGGPRLPDWCNVYEGLTDEEIEDLERRIIRYRDAD